MLQAYEVEIYLYLKMYDQNIITRIVPWTDIESSEIIDLALNMDRAHFNDADIEQN